VAEAQGTSDTSFKAAWTFRFGFLRRHELSLRRSTRKGQQSPADAAAVALAFATKVRTLMTEHNVDIVFNADQTAVLFEYIPRQTITRRGDRTVWVRCAGRDKARVTAMLLGDSRGGKYAPFVIAKAQPSKVAEVESENKARRHGFGQHVWREVTSIQEQHDVVIHGNPRGWWKAELSIAFLRHHFSERDHMEHLILLIWDELSAHWTSAVRAFAAELNVILIPVSAGCTCVCQPADISWNKPLKSRLRAKWMDNLQAQLKAPRADGVRFKLLPPTRNDAVEWLVDAWSALTPRVIVSGFSFIFTPSDASAADGGILAALDAATEVAAELEQLDMLDAEIGRVAAEDDVVDHFLDSGDQDCESQGD
jgi:hypothetical protein